MQTSNVFERNPKKTIFVLVAVTALTADLLAGRFFIPVNYNVFRIPDPYFHHGLLPLKEARTRWGSGPEYAMITNSLGFRDERTRRVPLRSDRKRILFIGDSFTEGLGVSYEESFVGLIDRTLQSSNVEVLNSAVISYSPKLYYLKVKFLLEKLGLQFDELFVFIDVSDIQDELYYETFVSHDDRSIRYTLNRIHKEIARLSLFYYFFTREGGGSSERTDINFGWDDNINLEPSKRYPDFSANRHRWTLREDVLESWGREGLALAKGNMEKLIDLCRRHDVRVTIAVYPHPVQIAERDLESVQVEFWRDFARDRSISFIDLFPAFIGDGAPRWGVGALFLRGDSHWSVRGHSYVAKQVLPHLRTD